MSTTLTLTAATITRLARRPDLVAAFPFLTFSGRPLKTSGCSACGRTPTVPAWRQTAAAIFSLSKTRRAEFKAMVGVESVVWSVRSGGKMVARYL